MTVPQVEAFGLIGLAVVLFAWGRFRYDLVALVILVTAIVIGLVPSKHAFDGFSNEITIIIGAALVVSAAIERSGIVEAAMRPLIPRLKTEQTQIVGLVTITMLLSMLTKNVGALAMMMPMALQLARKTGTSPSRLLMPMSFASLLGGTVTLIGTSPNIIVSQIRTEMTGRPFRLFDFAPVGLSLAAMGLLFLFVGYRLLPKARSGGKDYEAALDASSYTTEVRVPEAWEMSARSIADLHALASEVEVTAILREGSPLLHLDEATGLRVGDTLLLSGPQKALDELIARAKLEMLQADSPLAVAQPKEEVRSVETVIAKGSALIGRSVTELDLQGQFNVKLLAVSRGQERLRSRLRYLRLREGDVLVLQAGENEIANVLTSLGLLPLAERVVRLGGVKRSYAPALILAGAMALVAFQLMPVAVAFVGAAVLMIAVGSLPMREAYGALDGHVLILIAALVPVSEAVRRTGGTELIATFLSHNLADVSPILALGALTLSAMLCAPFLHNVPTVLVLGPIAGGLAKHLGLNPDPFFMGVAVGAACDFLTPIGHQCNTLVMGPGGYRFSDYPRLGAPLSLLVIAVGVPLIAYFWPLVPALHH